MRTWEQCITEWENKKKSFTDKFIKNYIETTKKPPYYHVGICLTVDEYKRFKNEKRNLVEILGYCESGSETHSMKILLRNDVGKEICLKGFYKVIEVSDEHLKVTSIN